MTRKAGMKIFNKNRISGILKFSGIFQALGSNINTALKEIENPNHNKWSVDRAEKKEDAQKLLDHITKFIKDAVTDNYQEKITSEVDAFGVSDFLPTTLDEIQGKNKLKNEKLKFDNEMIVSLKDIKKEENNSMLVRAEEEGELTQQELQKIGIDDGNSAGPGFNGGKGGGVGFGDNSFGTGIDEGNNGTNPKGNEMTVGHKNEMKIVTNIDYRVIEINASRGEYRITFKPDKNIKDVQISLSVIGDSGNKSKMKIVSATIDNINKLNIKANSIYLSELKSSIWQSIEVNLLAKDRLKLEAEVYANFK